MNCPRSGTIEPRRCSDTVILVIEDDPCIGTLLADYLQEDRRYHVHLATNGKEALCMAQHIRPNLLMIDLRLPDIPGVEVYRQLRAHNDLATVPVLMLSAGKSSEEVSEHQFPFLFKPFTLDELDVFLDRLCPCINGN